MKIISKFETNSIDSKKHNLGHKLALEEVSKAVRYAAVGGGKEAQKRHIERGKMLPRERVANLLDARFTFFGNWSNSCS